MKKPFVRTLFGLFVWGSLISGLGAQDESNELEALLEKVFGPRASLDPEMVERVRNDIPGKRHYVDAGDGGKPAEVWFIDIDPRHRERNRPVLVKAIDENANLEWGEQPDLYEDLYFADWNADGKVDGVIDYTDADGDGDLDKMGSYFYSDFHGTRGLRTWWARDDGDDNLLWWNQNYKYYQVPVQQRTHFNGDESFYQFYIERDDEQWTAWFENPFLFFDRDGNGVTDEVIRVSGVDRELHNVRWSFNVDADATLENPRDYDVSMSAFAPGWSPEGETDWGVRYPEEYVESMELRGIRTGPMLARHKTTAFLRDISWARVMFTWVENDHNVDWTQDAKAQERWEGVIMHPSEREGLEMPAIGGPSTGPFNNRFEVVREPQESNAFYYNPALHRIHIRHADGGWIRVDWDGDRRQDMFYEFFDTDNDGYFDRLALDVDGEGGAEDTWSIDTSRVRSLPYLWEEFHAAYTPHLPVLLEELYVLNRTLAGALEKVRSGASEDPVWDLIQDDFKNEAWEAYADKFRNSDETLIYYLRLLRDRRIHKLKKLVPEPGDFWSAFKSARSFGDHMAMTERLRRQFGLDEPQQPFENWLAERRAKPKRQRVAWDNDWLPPSWGWESKRIAYRVYDGHFDFFGKRRDMLAYEMIDQREALSYHEDDGKQWGMDALHVGETAGCGGLTLYVDGEAYPLRNDGNPGDPTFENRLVEEAHDRVTLETRAVNVGPDGAYSVRIRPTALAGRIRSPVEVQVEGGRPNETVQVGIGLTKLKETYHVSDSQAGVMGLWGWQDPAIGWIGTGIVYPPNRRIASVELESEHQVLLEAEIGEPFTYHIYCTWLRGRQYPRSPSVADWLDELRQASAQVR